jgi:hypothetical protein
LHIWWPPEPHICSAPFKALFDISALQIPFQVILKEEWPINSEETLLKTQEDWEHLAHLERIPFLKSYYQFYTKDTEKWLARLRSLEPRKEFIDKVNELLAAPLGSGAPLIGIHIRRGDHRHCILNSPTDLFLQKMRNQLSVAPNTIFFLASDDEKEKKRIQEEFGKEKILSAAETLNRHTTKGGADAFLDFLVLSQCQEIWGSAGSSFSELAAQYGGARFVPISRTMCPNT